MRQPIQVLVYVARVANSKREYLLLRRVPSRGGFWQGITGGVEAGEEVLNAARRELVEETGLVPIEIQMADYSYSYPVGDRWRHLYADDVNEITERVFAAVVDGQQSPVIDPREHDQWQWCGINAALELLTWPENIEALKHCEMLLTRQQKGR